MPAILVVGATGQQGGGVINALLATKPPNLEIRVLTRNPGSAAAISLKRRGVILVRGDLGDRTSLQNALEGCGAAYLVTDFRGPEDIQGELSQGRLFVDIVKETGVGHLVFSSVAGADASEEVDHFHTKYILENYIRDSLDSWTFIRPAGFMEVIPPPGIGRVFFLGAMAALLGQTPQKYIACDDIGRAVAKALLAPAQYRSRVITLVGQIADVNELQRALEAGEGKKGWGRVWLPRWLVIALTPHHYKQMFNWLYYKNCQPGSPDETRQVLSQVMDIETWARGKQAERDARTHA